MHLPIRNDLSYAEKLLPWVTINYLIFKSSGFLLRVGYKVNIYQILPICFWIILQHFLQKVLLFQRERLQQIVDLFQPELKSKPEM